MEPPPPAAPPLSAAVSAVAPPTVAPPPPTPASHLAYPDSVDSSPRSRTTDSFDEQQFLGGGGLIGPTSGKLRLMCSYGGHIVPRPHDKSLCYVGGDTRIVVSDRHSTLSDLCARLSKTLLNGRPFTVKYQLPNEDLDSLISVTTDEDLENMIDEYDRLNSAPATAATPATKPLRLRLFLFPSKPESAASIGSLLENSAKSEDWFLNALNGATGGFSESASVNCLLGLDDDNLIANNPNNSNLNLNLNEKDLDASFVNAKGVSGSGGVGSGNTNKLSAQDVQSVPDSPMLETSSSFGSTSSSPSLANLPPIRVHVEEHKVGIEEQFAHLSVQQQQQQQKQQQQQQEDGGFVVLTSPPTGFTNTPATTAATVVSGVPMSSGVVVGEYPNRVFSDDERSEQGIPVGYRKPSQPQLQPQQQVQQQQPLQLQQKPAGGVEFPSPDSVSSDGSMTNPLSRKLPVIYQEQIAQIPTGSSRIAANTVDQKIADAGNRVQMQQAQEGGYVLQTQFDPQNPQLHQQQYVHANPQYIHHPSGAVPFTSYYPVYPPQQQHHPHLPALDQQFGLYYVAARPPQAFNLPMQQPNYNESGTAVPSSCPQMPPSGAMVPPPAAYNPVRNAPASKPEMATGVYRTAAASTPGLVQVPSNQHQPQYVGFTHFRHPSQSIAPTSAATANYGYEYADPSHAQILYATPQLAAQYQTMTSAPAVVLSESSAQVPTENIKQQVRTSQP